MENKILTIGLDVDDKNYHAYGLPSDGKGEVVIKCKADSKHLLNKLQGHVEAGYKLKFCYESTYNGFHLCRMLRKAGHECSIVATSLIPAMAGDRVKTDRLDAQKLAVYFSKGLLTEIHVPDVEDEVERTLIRSRTFIRGQLKDIKKHVISVGKQIGWNYRQDTENPTASYWTVMHQKWISEKVKTAPEMVRANFSILLSHKESLERRLVEYEDKIIQMSQSEKYKTKLKALTCYQGIDILGAMILITEIGDVRRFSHPKKLVSYAGMDIIEYSSGGKEKRYALTKMGNKFIRTILTEVNQNCNRRPVVGRFLKKRREGTDPKFIQIADRCRERLHKKAQLLLFKGKPVNKIKSACAREMIGFVWESLMKAS